MNRTPRIALSAAIAALIGVAALSSPSALAQSGEGSGVRGGGHLVDINGRKRLRDLVDRSVCKWEPLGQYAVRTAPQLSAALAELRKTHWYLERVIQQEIDTLSVCRSGKLRQLPGEDLSSVATWWDGTKYQVAIRLNDSIYLDEKFYDQLPEEDKAILFIHEIAHAFIPMGEGQFCEYVPQLEHYKRHDHVVYVEVCSRLSDLGYEERYKKLRSFSLAIHEVFKKKLDAKGLALNMKKNTVQVLNSSAPLDPHRADIETTLDPNAAAESRIDSYRKIPADVLRLLNWQDQQALVPVSSETIRKSSEMRELLLRIIRGQTQEQSLDTIFRFGMDPNAIIKSQFAGSEWVGTIVSYAILNGRLDIAERLLALPGVLSTTKHEAISTLIELNDNASNELASNALEQGWVGANEFAVIALNKNNLRMFKVAFDKDRADAGVTFANGRTFLMVAARAPKGTPFVEFLLTVPRVSVNQIDEQGSSAFDHAVMAKSADSALKIAAAPGFKYRYQAIEGDGVANHERAMVILKQFVDQNLVGPTQSMLDAYPFRKLDLLKHAEWAKVRGWSELEKVIRQKMKQESRQK